MFQFRRKTFFLTLLLSVLTLPVLLNGSALMAETERPTLKVGWVLSPPMWKLDKNGNKTGFFIELAQLIADEIDHDLIVTAYDSPKDLVMAQNSGATDMIAGGSAVELFQKNNIFSLSVGQTQSRLFVHAEQAISFDMETAVGRSIGNIAPNWAPEMEEFLSRNIEERPTSTGQAVIGLLSGEYDAILYPEETVSYLASQSRIDHLILPIGKPFGKQERAVILHRSRSELLPSINTATKKLEADGTLPALRKKYRMQLFDPAPEVLTVAFPEVDFDSDGHSSLAPNFMRDETGAPSGMAIEVFQNLAERAGIPYKFKTVPFREMVKGPDAAGVDIVPLMGVTPARRDLMDMSLPAEKIFISATVKAENAVGVSSLEDLQGRRVGVPRGAFAHIAATKDPALRVQPFDTPQEGLEALLKGNIDAFLAIQGGMTAIAEDQGVSNQVIELERHVYEANRAIALRFGLGVIREQLNHELPGFLLSSDFEALRNKYFGEPVFWTDTRIRAAYASLFTLVTLFLGLLFAFLISERALRRERRAHEQAEIARSEAEEKKAETLDLSSRLQAVMDAASSGVVALRRNGDIAIANPRARSLLGLGDNTKFGQQQGKTHFSNIDEVLELEGNEAPFRRAMNGAELEGELFLLHREKEKQKRYVRLSSSSISLSASPDIGTVIILDDVTEQERHRTEAERSGRLSAVGQLTGGVAHDFNNLLAVIMGNLELLKETEDDPDNLQMIDAGLSATKRGADLTHSLLAFARQARLEPENLDLNSVVLEAQNWMRRALQESVLVETSLLAGLWPVRLDRTALESALLNLILNARDAMGGKGNLTIETANLRIDESYVDSRDEELTAGRYVMLAVSDTGSGIARENLDHLFEPFFTTKGPGGGSGVGLSMVLGFVKQSGGTVQVYTETGVGTTFKMFFPASTQSNVMRPKEMPSDVVISQGKKRILLAEDEQSVREVLVSILTGAGYSVTAASSGDAALEVFHSEPKFDLLVTDVVMPGNLQGTDLAKAIRPLQPGLPMIFLSGYASEATVHGNGLQPNDIRMMKPVPKAELLNAIARVFATKTKE